MSELTVDDLAQFLNITLKDEADKPDPRRFELGEHLAAAVATVEARTGPIWTREISCSVRSVGGLLVLPYTRLESVESIIGPDGEVDSVTIDLAAGLVWLSTTYGELVDQRPYIVTLTAGRPAPPADLVRAVLYVAGHLWESQRGRSQRSGQLGEERTGPTYGIPYVAQTLMHPWLLPVDARSV